MPRPDDHTIHGVSILFEQAGKVLLIRRKNPPFAGYWSLPGGRIEPGEQREEAAMREALEETGLTVEALQFVGHFNPGGINTEAANRPPPGKRYLLHGFLAIAFSGTAQAGDDAAEYQWREIGALDVEPMTPGTAAYIRRTLAETGRGPASFTKL